MKRELKRTVYPSFAALSNTNFYLSLEFDLEFKGHRFVRHRRLLSVTPAKQTNKVGWLSNLLFRSFQIPRREIPLPSLSGASMYYPQYRVTLPPRVQFIHAFNKQVILLDV